MMYEHLHPILHFWLEEDGHCVEEVVAHLQCVQVTEFGRNLVAVWVGQVVLVWVPEPVTFTPDGIEPVGKKENYQDKNI